MLRVSLRFSTKSAAQDKCYLCNVVDSTPLLMNKQSSSHLIQKKKKTLQPPLNELWHFANSYIQIMFSPDL